MSNGGQLLLERNSDDDIKMRDLYVKIDDEPERTLHFGESLTLPLSPGEHSIQVSNRIYKKNATFTLGEGETVRFEGVNVPKRGLLSLLAGITGTMMYRPLLRRLADPGPAPDAAQDL
jgi:hypothetical protein